MNTERIARGWDLIAEGAAEIALAYRAIEQSAAGGGVPPRSAPAPAATIDDDLPPLTDADAPFEDAPRAARTAQEPRQDTALGFCPQHGVNWKVVPAGVSKKTQKPYDAFYACPEKGCNEKPLPVWRNTHPIRAAA